MVMHVKYNIHTIIATTILVFLSSCTKLLDVEPPRTDLLTTSVFSSNTTAEAAVFDLYYSLKNGGFGTPSRYGISYLSAISSDEVIDFQGRSISLAHQEFNNNQISPNNSVLGSVWASSYSLIYKCNSVLEGLSNATTISAESKKVFQGEALFIRAFCYFYLVNLWGDVPLVLTTDYSINNSITRSSTSDIYTQIKADLILSQSLLPEEYEFASYERVRANKGAATALLARVYLFSSDWTNAEVQSSSVINNTLYQLDPDLVNVFKKTSKEPILQLWSMQYPAEYTTYNIHSSVGPLGGIFRPEFVNDFSVDDKRRQYWIKPVTYSGVLYYGQSKYRYSNPPEYFSTVLRLAEQYLIRSEARAEQGDLSGALSDVNEIRRRAGLLDTTTADKAGLLGIIERERKLELFAEWGHRWLDLKRMNRAAAVLSAIKPEWDDYKKLWPIPEVQLLNDPNVIQNPGY